jgi:sugar O-acyltransferase (sialic acid O-acetyltransferase NeuD family)
MDKPDIFIFGASDHARVVIDIVEREGRYSIIGLFDSFKTRGTMVAGYEVLGNEDDLGGYASGCGLTRGIVGIGDNAARQRIGNDLRRRIPSIEYVTAVHPSSTLSGSVELCGGSIVMARCYVGLNTIVGEGAVIATNSIFEHDGVIGPYATLGAGSTTGGHVTIGEGSGVCLGVTIIHGIKIGDHSVIGAGSCVIDDIPSNVVAYGSPARIVRSRDQSSSYLHIRSASYIAS